MLYAIMGNSPASYEGASITVPLEAYGTMGDAKYALQHIQRRIIAEGHSGVLHRHVSGEYVLPEHGFWISPWSGRKFNPTNEGQECSFVDAYGKVRKGQFVSSGGTYTLLIRRSDNGDYIRCVAELVFCNLEKITA